MCDEAPFSPLSIGLPKGVRWVLPPLMKKLLKKKFQKVDVKKNYFDRFLRKMKMYYYYN